ncbi:hypothetical protein [Leisingera sp. ANG1]|uniref:hypothetical protein n=2 Tax=unclassified Leisingera TaxID=2614906 RepID=UPI0002E826E9|nr:hypothetical protein [Leisingera sp. ANG1]KIC54497.1 hypothetical protein RA22_07635 [Leisingera sp. ANG-S]KID10682.1 hypothetical protein GC1_03120 [Leisingera sp. ANG1]
MSMKMKIEGAGDIERALSELARGTAKGVMRRAMKKALQPVKQGAENSAFEIAITSKLSPRQQGEARGDRGRAKVSLYVGPVEADGSHAPHAHLIEFGTGPRRHASGKYVGAVMADPFMRPAWDANRERMLQILRKEVWAEIEKAVERAARKAAKAAG